MTNKYLYNIFLTWLVLFSVAPFILILLMSFSDGNGHFTFQNYVNVLDPIYIELIFNSIMIATIVTIISCIIIIPLTFIITLQKNKHIWLILFLIPSWINLLLKVYAFIGLLGTNGLVNKVVLLFGFEQINFLFNLKGFLIVTVYVFTPFMMIPLYNSIIKIEPNLLKSAYDLGASNTTVFFKIVLPLCKNAILAGVTLIFIPSLSIFMISRLVTGNKIMTLGSVIEQQFLVIGDWNFGSSIVIVLILIMMLFSICMKNLEKIQIRRKDD